MKELTPNKKILSLIIAAIVMALGLILFKYVPMSIFGKDILFDASMHITIAVFILYVIWYFIDQNKQWRMPYLVLALAVVVVIAVQRIISNAHNDLGILMGLLISLLAIVLSRWSYFHDKFNF